MTSFAEGEETKIIKEIELTIPEDMLFVKEGMTVKEFKDSFKNQLQVLTEGCDVISSAAQFNDFTGEDLDETEIKKYMEVMIDTGSV